MQRKKESKIGDSVRVGDLVFKIEKFIEFPGVKLACGNYGCFKVDLLEKVK